MGTFLHWQRAGVEIKMFGLGEASKGYNPKVHGPYDPSVYYGPKDTPFGQTKLGELPGWLMRRSKNPADWGRAASRAYWRWQFNYILPKKAGSPDPFSLSWAFAPSLTPLTTTRPT